VFLNFALPKNVPSCQQNAALEKTKKELYPDLCAEQAQRLREIQQQKKREYKKLAEQKKAAKMQAIQEKEARSYDRIMDADLMTSTKDVAGTADATAAEEYEDDFF